MKNTNMTDDKKLKPITKHDLRMEAMMIWTLLENHNALIAKLNDAGKIINDLSKRIKKLEEKTK